MTRTYDSVVALIENSELEPGSITLTRAAYIELLRDPRVQDSMVEYANSKERKFMGIPIELSDQ